MPAAQKSAGDVHALALAQRCHDAAAAAHPGLCDPAQTAAFADGADVSPEVAAFRAMHDVSVAGGGATCPGLGGEGGATFAKVKGDGKARGKAKDEEDEEEDDDEIDDLDPEDEEDIDEEDEGSGEFDVEDLDEEEEEEDEPPKRGAKAKGKKAGFAAGLVAKFREWTKAKRDEAPESDFGDPDRRLFPVADQDDLDSAAKLLGRARNPEKVKARLMAIAKRKGLKVPDAWMEKDEAEMSADVIASDESGCVVWA